MPASIACELENTADEAVPAIHAHQFYEAAGSRNKRFVSIPGANHYYRGQPEHTRQAAALVMDWMRENALMD